MFCFAIVPTFESSCCVFLALLFHLVEIDVDEITRSLVSTSQMLVDSLLFVRHHLTITNSI